MRPFGARRRVPVRVWVAAAVTVVVAPFLVLDALGGDEEGEVAVEGASVERPTTTVPADPAGPTSTTVAPVPPVGIDTTWLPMGTSSYGEEDDATADRIERRRAIVAAVLPPPTTTSTVPTEGEVSGPGTSTTTPPRRPTPSSVPVESPPTTSPPPPPTPAPTAPPETAPPVTEAPVAAPAAGA